MNTGYDYRYCINESLKIMREQRKKICDDTINGDATIYSGLHTPEQDSKLRNLYFELYILNWIDSHWIYMQNQLNRHNEYTINQKKEMTLFFAKYLSVFIKDIEISGNLSKLSIPFFLKAKIKTLNDLIQHSSKWEKNCQELRLLMKKQQEHFKKQITEYEKD